MGRRWAGMAAAVLVVASACSDTASRTALDTTSTAATTPATETTTTTTTTVAPATTGRAPTPTTLGAPIVIVHETDGLRVTLTIDPGSTPRGRDVRVALDIEDDTPFYLSGYSILYGDGAHDGTPTTISDCAPPTGPTTTTTSRRWSRHLEHAHRYTRPGRVTIKAGVVTPEFCGSGRRLVRFEETIRVV